ncbi:hypothetical protein [Roseovarius sp. MMSF_3281]|uniref:hypothetical protein n=1 Tax=Roseovarius sp. MMSF_3281 TaxID=3046694 RepID=UPI00273D78F2|nr:hypothetical protein [Roseovarius sp. MMSF_3281]
MPKNRITVLAPFDVVEIIAAIGRETGQFSFCVDAYSDSREIVDLFHRHRASSDAFLIGGPLAYDYLMEKMAGSPDLASVSVGYIPYDETAIFRALFEMARVRPNIDLEAMRLSIDHPAGEHIRECVEEINLGVANTFSKECISADDVADLASFHVDLWKQQKITAALTSVHFVYERLRELSVPVHRIHPSKSAIRTALTSLEERLQEKLVQDQQIAMVAIRFADAGELRVSDDVRRIVDRRRLLIEKRLDEIARRFSGVMQWASPIEANILTTRRYIELQAFTGITAQILCGLRQDFGVDLAVVVGIADAANEALALARSILDQRDFDPNKGIWVVDIDGVVQHSFESDVSLRYESRSTDPDLVEKAKLAKIGIGTVNRVFAFAESQRSGQFTARQLANWMSVTPRSARRIISRLEKNGLLEKCGAQQSFGRGRPVQLFRKVHD